MKQPGLLTMAGIAFMSIVLSAEAQSTPRPNVCPSVTTISDTNIGISLDEDCFPEDTSFDIELMGTECKLNNYECTDYPCLIETNYMSCPPGTIKACTTVTFIITGKISENNTTRSIQVAPWIKPGEWHLDKSSITNDTLNARWGPPNNLDSEFVSCADTVYVVATCSGQEISPATNPIDLVSHGTGSTKLDINVCNAGEEVILTVTYYLENVPTESKGSTTLTKPGTSTTTTIATVPTDETDTSNATPTISITQAPRSDNLNWWEGLLIALAVLAALALIAFAIYCFVKKEYCFSNC